MQENGLGQGTRQLVIVVVLNIMKHKPLVPDPKFVSVDAEGNAGDMSVLHEQDVAYDPAQMTVDLTKAQKRRTTALMLAIQAYEKLIIKDAEYFIAVSRESHTNPDLKIRPATISAMVDAALQFDDFIAGRFEVEEENSGEGESGEGGTAQTTAVPTA